MAKRQCKGKTKTGAACKATPRSDTGYCNAHSSKEVQESSGFGGAQPGAGRPRNPRAVDVLRERLEANIDAVLGPLFDALEADRGLVVGAGENAVLESVPDWDARLRAVKEVLDRAYGRPKQMLEHTGAGGETLGVDVVLDKASREAIAGVLRRRPAASGE